MSAINPGIGDDLPRARVRPRLRAAEVLGALPRAGGPFQGEMARFPYI